MANPYTSVSITGYNANPPPDDGSNNADNEITWAKHKGKLGDPLKDAVESINTNVSSAFDSIFLNAVVDQSGNYTVQTTDQGALINVTGTNTITLPAAGTATEGFAVAVRNNGSGTVTVDADGSETINGETTIELDPGSALLLTSDGANWIAVEALKSAITTEGDLVQGDSNGNPERLAIGGNDTVLLSNGTVASWGQVDTGGLQDSAVTTVKIANDAVVNTKVAANAIAAPQLQSDAVTPPKLKTSTGTVSVTETGGDNTSAHKVLPGGDFGFFPRVQADLVTGESATVQILQSADQGFLTNSFQTVVYIQLGTVLASGSTITVEQTYVSASPPYDLGDGDVPLFVFVDLDATGEIVSYYAAPDPPWANNGPTDIRPDRIDPVTGKAYRTVTHPGASREAIRNGRATMAEVRNTWTEEVEITKNYKNSDMQLIPHATPGGPPPGGQIVLLDPPATLELLELHQAGEDIGLLLREGYIQITNESINRVTPPGVNPAKFRFRAT